MDTPTFEWDPSKAAANLRAHGVSFEEAVTVFQDPLAKIHPDPDHSESERREILIGRSAQARLLLVAFTDRQGVGGRQETRKSDHRQSAHMA